MSSAGPNIRLALLRAGLLLAAAVPALANPIGMTITGTSGGAAVTSSTSGSTMTVTTGNAKTLLDWTSFGVNNGETLIFNMADKNAIVVNRQSTGSMSNINGTLTSTYGANGTPGGNVWIINPNGVYFGYNSVVDVGGLLATTADLKDATGFLNSPVDAPVSMVGPATLSGYESIYQYGAVTVRDGSATFISTWNYLEGTVHGAGHNPNATQVIYGSARDFTLRYSAASPDPLSATDLHLFDLVVDRPAAGVSMGSAGIRGGGMVYRNAASTTAGQVVFLAQGDSTAFEAIDIRNGSITATGIRGDGNDVLITNDNMINGAPAGTAVGSGTPGSLELGRLYNTDTGPVINSAGGVNMRAQNVAFGGYTSYSSSNGGWTDAIPEEPAVKFNVAGATKITGDSDILLINPGSITPTVVSGGEVRVTSQTAPLSLGNVTANGPVVLESASNVSLGAVTGATSLNINSGSSISSNALSASGVVTVDAAGSVTVESVSAASTNIKAGVSPQYSPSDYPSHAIQSAPPAGSPASTLTQTGTITTTGATDLFASGNLSAGNISASAVTINAGGSVTTGTLAATTSAVTVNGAGDVTLAGVSGTDVNLAAGVTPTTPASAPTPPAGSATGKLTVTGTTAATGTAMLTASGNLVAASVSGAGIAVSAGGTAATGALNSAGGVNVNAGGDATIGGATSTTLAVQAGQNAANTNATLSVIGPVNTTGTASFSTTGTFSNTGAITAAVPSGATSGYMTPISITSRDVAIQAPITASAGTGNVGIMLMVQSNGDMAVGDNTGAASGTYTLSNAEFAQLKAGALFLVPANLASGTSGNLTVGDLPVDASKLAYVSLDPAAATPNQQPTTASVVGTVSGSGATTFNIGSHIRTYYLVPGRILVSGSLGTSAAPLANANLSSQGGIVIGTTAFQNAFAAAQQAGAAASFTPETRAASEGGAKPGQTFILAKVVGLSANGAIMQQNTDPQSGGGIGSTATPATIKVYPWSAAGIAVPQRVALFGVVANPATGSAAQGAAAPGSGGVNVFTSSTQTGGVWVDTNPVVDPAYKLNGCTIGGGNCVGLGSPTSNEPETRPATVAVADPTTTATDSTSAASAQSAPTILVVLPSTGFVQPGRPEDKPDESSGAANEDLWPKGKQ